MKLLKIFKRRDRKAEAINALGDTIAVLNSYVMALARLGFLKPADIFVGEGFFVDRLSERGLWL